MTRMLLKTLSKLLTWGIGSRVLFNETDLNEFLDSLAKVGFRLKVNLRFKADLGEAEPFQSESLRTVSSSSCFLDFFPEGLLGCLRWRIVLSCSVELKVLFLGFSTCTSSSRSMNSGGQTNMSSLGKQTGFSFIDFIKVLIMWTGKYFNNGLVDLG